MVASSQYQGPNYNMYSGGQFNVPPIPPGQIPPQLITVVHNYLQQQTPNGISSSVVYPNNYGNYGQTFPPNFNGQTLPSNNNNALIFPPNNGQPPRQISTPHGAPVPAFVDPNDPQIQKDAEDVNEALAKGDVDEEKLKNILTHRTCKQRQAIQIAYNKKYGLNLYRTIHKYTTHTYETLLKCCFFCDAELLAVFFDKAVETNKDSAALRSIFLATETETLKNQLKTFYHQRYGHDILKRALHYFHDQSGDYRNMVTEMLTRVRREVDPPGTPNDAQLAQALRAEVPHWGKHRTTLDAFLIETPMYRIPNILIEYKKIGNNEDFLETVWNHKRQYFTVAHFITDPMSYYAAVCDDSIGDNNHERDVKPLILIGLYQNERNITDITAKFHEKYPNKDLMAGMKKITDDRHFEDLLQAFYEGYKSASPQITPQPN